MYCRTRFEENEDFLIVLNSVVARRYIIEYLGSAAFSKVVQAQDLLTGMDVCLKIIKNDKDFFDQSLDEIKLLKLVNKYDPLDEHHVLRLYDYFYHQTAVEQSTKVIDAVKPVASAAMETIMSLGPEDYVMAARAAFLAYLLVPPVWSLVSFSLRGYKGDLTPAQTLDKVTTQGYVLIDVWSDKDKAKARVPQLPSNAKNKLVSVPMEDLSSKLKGMVRNAKKAEAEIAALKISYLNIGKGSNVIIIDSYNDVSKTVANTLNSVGFKNCWVMAGDFSGQKGRAQSRLGTDSYNPSVVEVVTPS